MGDTELATTDDVGISDGALTTVAGYSALAGLCPLLPVPFLDDVIITRIHRRLCQVLCSRHDFYLSTDGAVILTSRPSNLLAGAFFSLLLWPIKKILRKLVYVLAVKSCADVAAGVFHEGWLLARALEQGYVPLDAMARGDNATLRHLRDGVMKARDQVDTAPTRLIMRSAFGVGREVFNPILKSIKGVVRRTEPGEERIDAAEESAAPIAVRIQDEVRKHWSNGPELDAALREALRPPEAIGSERPQHPPS